MLSLYMWDMKVEITAGRMHYSLTQFMHFFLQKNYLHTRKKHQRKQFIV